MSELPLTLIAPAEDGPEAQNRKRAALSYLDEAIAEARVDGLDAETLAHAALFAGWSDLIARHGEEAVAKFAESVPEKIRQGSYSSVRRH
jgi:hypothetical protein